MFDIPSIKAKEIASYLRNHGYQEKRSNGKWTFFMSPFREETNPSFGVNNIKNTWSDFGTEDGGDIIELVMKIEKVDFLKACEILQGNKGISLPNYTPPKIESEAIIIIEDYDWDLTVWDYMIGIRGISPKVLRRYCSPVLFRFTNSESHREYSAAGFRNDLNGWEARNINWKVASLPKSFSTIKGESGSDVVNLFEGFIDFLSALTYWGKVNFKDTSHVMNGTGMIGSLLPFLKGKKVRYFGDNDKDGDKILYRLREEGILVTDFRGIYDWHNDFNAFLTNNHKRN